MIDKIEKAEHFRMIAIKDINKEVREKVFREF